ncbi:hypothetical protein X769_13220 [Mesorhizobium sp. LSJC268A00]|nr:hypothetical protein X769_13220 [Mesorhizobium sp. LSJC268A00]ESZ14885.1 hypothetical protein X735_14915 [Mesorhizobium sp. L2C085B000]
MTGHDPHLQTPAGKPRARAFGITFEGTPGGFNAITDVPGVSVGYATLIPARVCSRLARGRCAPASPPSSSRTSISIRSSMRWRKA